MAATCDRIISTLVAVALMIILSTCDQYKRGLNNGNIFSCHLPMMVFALFRFYIVICARSNISKKSLLTRPYSQIHIKFINQDC